MSVTTTNSAKSDVFPQRVMIRGVIYRIYEDRAIVMGRSGPRLDITIRDEVRGKKVTAINRRAFQDDSALQSIKFPNSLKTIGSHSFENCVSLTEIELPTNLEKINWNAFAGCTGLKRVYLPFAIQRIGHHAFSGCSALEETPHFVQTGPRSQAKLSRSLVEQSLPVSLSHLGESAFEGCTALKRVVVPFKIKSIPANLFRNCESLVSVWLHARIQDLGDGAFQGCLSLDALRIPETVSEIGADAISESTTIISESGSMAIEYAKQKNLRYRVTELPPTSVSSLLGAPTASQFTELVSDNDFVARVVEHYEVRPSAPSIERSDYEPSIGQVPASRFRYKDGIYYQDAPTNDDNDVTLALTGDLMCGFRQQRLAADGTSYNFDEQLQHVAPIFRQSDLAIGNLETMVNPKLPFMSERLYIDDRPNLNSPIEYLASVRRMGFDAVMSAQNHMYDTGVQGILETLDALNQTNLIHGGLFSGSNDPRVLHFNIKGMHIAIVAYLDPIRQRMKKANFTAQGLKDMASLFDEEQIVKDIKSARDAGAEFILAYAHWGVEYTSKLADRQLGFAEMLANSGVDYIFGSHSHCPQPFDYTESATGKRVPTLFSAGNFLADIQRHAPITHDAVLGLVKLTRDSDGQVVLAGNGYIPCRIVQADRASTVTVVPCEALADGLFGFTESEAIADAQRIGNVLGDDYTPISIKHVRDSDQTVSVWQKPAVQRAEKIYEVAATANDFGFNPLVHLDKNSLESALMEVQALGFGLSTKRYSTQVFTAADEKQNEIGFKRVASNLTSMVGLEFCADKILCKTLLLENGLPTAFGLPMPRKGYAAAKRFADDNGWPVVVKPRRGSGGRAVTANIQNHEQLEAAVKTADEFGGFLIEKHVPGEDYRFLVSGDEVLGVWCRDAANVIGDGKSSIDELIEIKNALRSKNPHLASRLIKKDDALIHHLRWSGLTLAHVPGHGEKIYLRSAANLSAGGDNIDLTDETHDSLKEIAVQAKKALPGIELVGIDFLMQDHRLPVTEQVVNICEINSTPGVSAHEYPMFGKPRPAARNYVEHIAKSSNLVVKPFTDQGDFVLTIHGQFKDDSLENVIQKWATTSGVTLTGVKASRDLIQVEFSGTTVGASFMSYSTVKPNKLDSRITSCELTRK